MGNLIVVLCTVLVVTKEAGCNALHSSADRIH
jgi:hypothetical protein